MDDLQAARGLYAALRRKGTATTAGMAYLLWSSQERTSYIVCPDGTCLPRDRATLIAQLRILLLRAEFPVEYVARYDRDDN